MFARDTDGIDGSEDHARTLFLPYSMQAVLGLRPRAMFDNNDSSCVFSALDGLVLDGPLRTNVNDFRVVFILKENNHAAST